VGDLGLALEETYFTVNQVGLTNGEHFLNVGNALEPNQFKRTGGVFYFGHQPFPSFLTHKTGTGEYAGYLNEIGLGANVAHQVHFGFIDMAVGNKFEQVFKGVDIQLFFEQIGPLRPYALQVLNGIG
jgi:hypothetical protein